MRYIAYDADKLDYPTDWLAKAKAAQKAIESAPPDKRSDEIKKYSYLWSELKPKLSVLSNNKCWYTEAPQIGTDVDVDHFRPKNTVKGVKKPGTDENHPGYWWQALDPKNYRLSCIVANRPRRDIETGILGGKHDEFPVWDETCRAWSPEDECDNEQPLLIDPCKAADVNLLFFNENGEAAARYSKDNKPRLFARADCSIRLYHLNHKEFVRARQEIRDDLKKQIEHAQRLYKRLDGGDAQVEDSYNQVIEKLCKACSAKSPFSSFAIAILETYRGDESIEAVLRMKCY